MDSILGWLWWSPTDYSCHLFCAFTYIMFITSTWCAWLLDAFAVCVWLLLYLWSINVCVCVLNWEGVARVVSKCNLNGFGIYANTFTTCHSVVPLTPFEWAVLAPSAATSHQSISREFNNDHSRWKYTCSYFSLDVKYSIICYWNCLRQHFRPVIHRAYVPIIPAILVMRTRVEIS